MWSLLLLFGSPSPPGAIVGSAAIAVSTSATLSLAAPLATTSGVRVGAAANLTAPESALATTSGLQLSTTGSLSTTARLTTAAGFRVSATASFLPATMLAAAGLRFGTVATITPSPRATSADITIGGVDVKGRVRLAGLTIHDILNDAPNTCSLTIEGDGPAVGQSLRITMNEGSRVLFAGAVQTVDQSFDARPAHVAWHVTAIDDTAKANERRPFGTWVDTSATTIARDITTRFAPTFSTAGIAANLPPVSIVFDGSDTFIAALARLATAIGGYTKIEDGTIYLFIVDESAAPDPIDAAHRFLFRPAITATIDSSQLRTRVYGKGYGESIQADLAPGESLIPIQDGATFPALGGDAIAATTPDGAQSERVAFTGVALAAGGTLVGPGAGPTVAPVLAIAAGSGVDNGRHDVAVVFVTATGQSLPGPFASIDVPTQPPPPTAPVAAAALVGTGPDQGSHDYVVAFQTAVGETTPSPISNAIATSAAVGQLPPPDAVYADNAQAGAGLDEGYHDYKATLLNANGETTPGTQSVSILAQAPNNRINLFIVPTGPAGTTGRRLYRRFQAGGTWKLLTTIHDNTTTSYLDTAPNSSLGADAPTTNTTGTAAQRIPVSNIPIGPLGVIARKLYRRFNGTGSFRLVTTIANNTATTFTDAVPNTGLGAAALSTPTAVGNQIAVSSIPLGAAGVTARELYMSPGGTNVRKRALVIPNNTATTAMITASDATLGAAPGEPIADTSGLQQPQGQVNPGATALPVAAAATFRDTGGWVTLAGGQVVRYHGISGQTLTGIPASGSGAITTTVLYGSQALPTPMLVGVTGLGVAVLKGSAIHIWVQRDDVGAQAEQRARAGGTGIIEFLIVDARRGVESLTARCDADLALFARPIVTVAYATRDLKTQSGKTVDVDLASPRIHETLTIQDVTMTEIDLVPGLAPRFTVTASSVRFSLADTLRRLITVPTKIT